LSQAAAAGNADPIVEISDLLFLLHAKHGGVFEVLHDP